jgi:hypothetical protein
MNTSLRALLLLAALILIVFIAGIMVVLFWFPKGDAEITLYQQKIPDSDCVILDFDVWYGLDGHLSGRTIVDDIEDFDPFEAQHLPLEFIVFGNNNEIKGTEVWANDYNAQYMDRNQSEYHVCDLRLYARHLDQKSFGGICGGILYDFDSLFVATDSLILFVLISSDVSRIERDRLAVPLCNIMLYADSVGRVYQIQASILRSKEIDITNGEKHFVILEGGNVDTKEACLTTYILKPENQIYLDEFPDYGFFKPVKID